MHQAYRTKRPKGKRPERLLDFIRGCGGIRPDQPDAGDVRSMDAHLVRSRRGVNKPMRPKAGQGRYLDDLAVVAAEAGYIREADKNLLLEAIDLELRGHPVYALRGVDAVPLPPDAEPPEPEKARHARPGRPPKPEGALVQAPPFRLHPGDVEEAISAARASGEALGVFARRCFLAGLAQISGEGF